MKKALILLGVAAITSTQVGCATYAAKKHFDNKLEKNPINVSGDGEMVYVGVDLLSLDYLKQNWKLAVPAAIIDGLATYYVLDYIDEELNGSDGGSSGSYENENPTILSGRDTSTIQINGNDNTVTVGVGDQNADSQNDNSGSPGF